jgi:hypothetical protein
VADEDIDISISVDTGDSAAEVDSLRDKTRDAGEQLDELDGKTVDVEATIDTADAKRSIDDIGTTADKTGSVVANMAGNATADLADIAGAGSLAGGALGQFAEAAAEGEINLKNLGKAGPAIAGIGLVMFALSQRAKNAAENAAQVTEAIENLSRVADDEVINELGRAMVNSVIAGKPLSELFERMARDDLPGFRRAIDLAGEDSRVSAEGLAVMRQVLADVEGEMAQQEETARRYGDNLDDVATAADDTASALPTMIEPLAGVEGAMAGAAAATERLDTATSNLLGRINARQAWLNAQDAVEDYVRAVSDGSLSSREQERATLAAGEALLRYIDTLGNVPLEVKSEVTLALNEGDIGRAYAALDAFEQQQRTVTVNLALGTISGALAGALAGSQPRGRATDSAGGATITNYYPPRIDPTSNARAERTYRRVQGG